jgi:hypothetical protein
MEKFIPSFTNITAWQKNPYSSTGGTRSKKIYFNPANEAEYFFKCSKELKDGSIRYPQEFWSEIASSKIGQYLGFDVLDYNIGFDSNAKQQLGCLSKSMIEHRENTLTEGVDYLRGFDSNYDPNKDEHRYTLSFINKTLDFFGLNTFQDKFIEMLVFDAIIGNSDRHQENWGFITMYRESIAQIEDEIAQSDRWVKKLLLRLKKFTTSITLATRLNEIQQNKRTKRTTLMNQSLMAISHFSPIYDSGCCLGRELDDSKVKSMIDDIVSLERYVNKGESEVRWLEGRKPRHYDFLSSIKENHRDMINSLQIRISDRYKQNEIRQLIDHLDYYLPDELKVHNIPSDRKELMVKIVDLRVQRFLSL